MLVRVEKRNAAATERDRHKEEDRRGVTRLLEGQGMVQTGELIYLIKLTSPR